MGIVGDVSRFPSKAHFASYASVAPIEASSGEVVRRRLSLAGNCRLNQIMHMIAVCQARSDPRGGAYHRKKLAEGNFNVQKSGGQPNIIPVGSRAAREFIDQHSPILGLHGHIHESRYATTLGRTICINPGSNYADGVLDGAIVDLQAGEVERYQLVSG